MEVLLMIEQQHLLHDYSRTEAFRDGLLIDATSLAQDLGFRYGVALTRSAWERCVAVPDGVVCQEEVGRLHDVLHMLAAAIRRGDGGPEIGFAVYVRNSNRGGTPLVAQLRCRSGVGDDGEPCLTIMLPGEN